MRISNCFILLFLVLPHATDITAQHYPGESCISCHDGFALGGTVFDSYTGGTVAAQQALQLLRRDGSGMMLPLSDSQGRIFSPTVDPGNYLVGIGTVRSRTWHELPKQRDCNSCHLPNGNVAGDRNLTLPSLHTEIPEDNNCQHCHHFPASMHIDKLATRGTLNASASLPNTQTSGVIIRNKQYAFDPGDYNIRALRQDVFALGYYSFFDVLLAVAERHGHGIAWHWDADCSTHFIDSVDGIAADFWYRFSYDAGNGTMNELRSRRQIRWDELLYQPGSWVQLVVGENLDELRRSFREEIERERQLGHVIGEVRVSINPSDFQGNPPESNRVSVMRNWSNVRVNSHGLRVEGRDSLHRMPFQPGVVTAIDVLYSLRDQGELSIVGSAYYTHLAGKVMDSYRVRAIGFPDIGLAHASGRQGFVYTTGNGTFQRLINDADRKQHVHADIHVIHAPDFAIWRWIELGNPYYEMNDPTSVEELLADANAMDRGFRLQRPHPTPTQDRIFLSWNVFEAADYSVQVFSCDGRVLATLFHGWIGNIGSYTAEWTASDAGMYFIRMSNGRYTDVQRAIVVR